MPMGPLYDLLGELFFMSVDHFLNWIVFLVLSSMSYLYILEIKPLSNVSFANVLPHSWFPFYFDDGF